MAGLTRRAALLGGAGLLAGCESLTDTFDSLFGEKKVPLRGDRIPALSAERPVGVDAGAVRPVVLPPAVANPEWAQAGGLPSHAPGHLALGAGLTTAWSSDAGAGSGYRRRLIGAPVIGGGTAYAIDAFGEVTAFDVANGRRRWSFDSRPAKEADGALGAGAALEGGTLYLATGLAEVIAVDPADGKPRWRVGLPAPARGAPTVVGGRIFVSTTENQLIALSVEDGRRLWVYRGTPTITMALGLPSPAVEGDVVVAGFGSGELAALRASDGRAIWSESLASSRGGGLADIAAITALPVIERGRVIAGGLGGLTIAVDLRSGRRLWEREVGMAETPAVAGDWVFLLSTAADLMCLGRDDGRVRWITPMGRFRDAARKRDPITWAAPILAGGRLLLAGTHGQMAEVNPADGEVTGRVRLPAGVALQPAVADRMLYLLTESASLVAMRGAAAA